MTTSTRLKVAYAVLAATDTWLSGREDLAGRRARRVTKPLLMPTLAASLLTDPRASDSPLRATTLAAQAGGWGGDVALLGGGSGAFLSGVGSFGLGHVAYVVGFRRRRAPTALARAPLPRAIAGVWAATAPAMAVLAGRQKRELGLPVLGYSALLALMAASGSHLDTSVPVTARRLTTAGAVLFMVSDTMLGFREFARGEPPPALETAVMATYTTAQLLLSEGAARARWHRPPFAGGPGRIGPPAGLGVLGRGRSAGHGDRELLALGDRGRGQ